MKRLGVILGLAILLGSGAYFVSYGVARCTFCRMPDANDSSSWLRQEFHLSDAQYAQVKKLEADYHPHCIVMCDQIRQSHLALKNLILANGAMTPEIEAALKKDGEFSENGVRTCCAIFMRSARPCLLRKESGTCKSWRRRRSNPKRCPTRWPPRIDRPWTREYQRRMSWLCSAFRLGTTWL